MKKSVKKKPGRPPGRKAPRRPVISTRVPLPFYEAIKQAAQVSGRTISEELVWRTTQSFERDKTLEAAREEAMKMLADARHVKEEAVQAELERTHERITGADGTYWKPKGGKPLQVSVTPEFKAMLVDTMRQVFAEAKEEPK